MTMHKTLAASFALLVLLAAAPALAQTAAETLMANAKSRADQEITRRTNALTSLNTKVQAMTRVSSTQKSALATTVQTEISSLTTLNAKIQADADLATLRTDIASIAIDYRIFKLVIPQGYVLVTADRILTTTPYFSSFADTLQTRITQAQTAGKDVTAMNASLADMRAKAADATAQANAAIALVANLKPDGGDESIAASNRAALQSASAKIKVALTDLQVARQDAASIATALQGITTPLSVSLTLNGGTNITAKVGDTLTYAWSSTGAVSAISNYTQDSSSCGITGTGPFDLGSTATNGTFSELVTDCWVGHTYVINVTVNDGQGHTKTASATVKVDAGTVTSSSLLPFYQLTYQGTWQSHMFTTDEGEKNSLTASYGFQYAGVNAWVLGTNVTGSVRWHRMYHPTTGAHLYTASTDEVQNALSQGYTEETGGNYGYVYPATGAQPAGTVPLYRAIQAAHPDYYWTTSSTEYAQLLERGWVQQGVVAYVYGSATVPDTTSCAWNGSTIANGVSVTAYQSSSVPTGTSCISQTRTCSNGTLSGSYTYPTCSVAANTNAPTGTLDNVDSQGNVTGWAVDKDVPSSSINVSIYADAPKGQGTLIATVPANASRPDVNTSLGVTGNHGFVYKIASQYLTQGRKFYVYGLDSANPSSATVLANSPDTYTTTPSTSYTYATSNFRGGDGAVTTGSSYNYDPSVIYDNGIYRAYWCGPDSTAPGDNILYAEATSLAGPWHSRNDSTPNTYDSVLHRGSGWDGVHTCDPTVMKVNGTYYLYYTGSGSANADGPNYIGFATSPDGFTWTRGNGGQPILGTSMYVNRGLVYGAGSQSVTYANGKWYLMYMDTTGTASLSNGAGEYLIRADNPEFTANSEIFVGTGWVPHTAATVTSYIWFNGMVDDMQYIPQWNAFLVASHSDANMVHLRVFDGNTFTQIADVTIPNTAWSNGPGLVSNAEQRTAIMKDANTISADTLRGVGPCVAGSCSAKLAWRGADLVRTQSVASAPSSEYLANALTAIESALQAIGSWLGR